MIETRALAVRAGRFALRDLSFVVPPGGWTALLGAVGAGKSTLLEAIAGVRPLASGRVLLHGTDVTAVAPERREVGLVYQQAMLFPHLDVRANVAYGERAPGLGRDFLARLGGEALLARGTGALSGGERQLVALARAFARRPRVLLLDEPFAALDPRLRGRTRETVRRMAAELDATVLQVTHDHDEARRLATDAVVLAGGTLLAAGPVAEALAIAEEEPPGRESAVAVPAR